MLLSAPNVVLLLALLAGVAVSYVKTNSGMNWRRFFVSASGSLLAITLLLAVFSQPGMSYRLADSVRVIHGALRDIEKGLPDADCVVVFDGSSSSAYALDKKKIVEVLSAAGHKPCVVSLVNHAGEHLEREWTAERLRKALPAHVANRIRELPLLWVKEMLWLYESNPARFAAKNRGTDRALACSDPLWGIKTLNALWTDWQDARKNTRMDRNEAWEAFPADRLVATLHHTLFNLFQCGRLHRLMQPAVVPQHVMDEMVARPEDRRTHQWWKDAPKPGEKIKPSNTLRPRRWFKDLVEHSPSGWSPRVGLEQVLFMAPVQNETVIKYSDLLQREGLGVERTLLNAQADIELVQRMHDPGLWSDTIHMDVDGAEIFSEWLAVRLAPVLTDLRERHHQAMTTRLSYGLQ